MKLIRDSVYMTQRHLMALWRQPFWIVFMLVQPVIWLALYGQLFRRVVELPGFHATSYVSFLMPGVVVTNALFGGGWQGMGIIADLERGIIDRFLLTPVSRPAIIAGRILSLCVGGGVQSLILIGLGFLMGARYGSPWIGLPLLVAASMLMMAAFGALSNAMALVVRKEESVIGASNMLLLPMTFLSPIYMAKALMPEWMQKAAMANPVTWAVESGREALDAAPDWGRVTVRLATLAAFTVMSMWVATRAFRNYQRSV